MTPIFEFKSVTYHYPGQGFPALQNFSITIPALEKIAVVGKNGAGKSTFFLHCNGLKKPDVGEIIFQQKPMAYDRSSLRHLRQEVGLIFQNPDDQLFSASVAQDISFGPLNLGLSKTEAHKRVQAAANLCQIGHLLDRPTHALSGGEKARVALAGIFAMQPSVLVADEPMASLDPWVRLALFDILEHYFQQGKTILMATHNLSVVRDWATYVVVLQQGQAVFSGTPEALLTDQAILDQTGLSQVWEPS